MFRNVLAVSVLFLSSWTVSTTAAAELPASERYAVRGSIAGPAIGGWDYATIDSATHRLDLATDGAHVVDTEHDKNWPAGRSADRITLHCPSMTTIGAVPEGGGQQVDLINP
jgi:hypothetical protein